MLPLDTLQLDRDGPPLSAQLAEALRARILSGALQQGEKLPSSRALSAALGLARATVVVAYDQLTAEGYVEGRRGAGIFVSAVPDALLQTESAPAPALPPKRDASAGPQPFRPGLPDRRLFPHQAWSRTLARSWRGAGPASLGATEAFGDPRLRAAIAEHLRAWRGIETSAETVVITAGAAGALELLFRALAAPGDRIALEDPGYLPTVAIAQSFGLEVAALPVDDSGLDADALERLRPAPKLLVATPTRQYPLGMALSLERRARLLDWARSTGGVIVEDDYDSEFRYAGRPLPALAAIDPSAPVIYVGTFSKVFAPELRIGWLATPERLRPAIAAALARYGGRASYTAQPALAEFMENGDFGRHVRRMRRAYAARRDALLAALDQECQGLLVPGASEAGMSMPVYLSPELAAETMDREIAKRAASLGLEARPLSGFYAGRPGRAGLLLGFSGFDEREIGEAVRKLAAALRPGG